MMVSALAPSPQSDSRGKGFKILCQAPSPVCLLSVHLMPTQSPRPSLLYYAYINARGGINLGTSLDTDNITK